MGFPHVKSTKSLGISQPSRSPDNSLTGLRSVAVNSRQRGTERAWLSESGQGHAVIE